MTAREVLDRCLHEGVVLSRCADGLHVEPLDSHPLPPDLLAVLRDHKQAVLALLDYMAQADALLIASSVALGKLWPSGCDLDSDWDRLEDEMRTAYGTGDLGQLRAALADRDQHALEVFGAYRGRAAGQDQSPQHRRTVTP